MTRVKTREEALRALLVLEAEREQRYAKLAEVYHLSPREIALMTPHQQKNLATGGKAGEVVYAASDEEYERMMGHGAA